MPHKETALSADDKKWRAESDARTLAEAETITKDEARLKEAQSAAKRLAEESETEAESMATVAEKLYGNTD